MSIMYVINSEQREGKRYIYIYIIQSIDERRDFRYRIVLNKRSCSRSSRYMNARGISDKRTNCSIASCGTTDRSMPLWRFHSYRMRARYQFYLAAIASVYCEMQYCIK